MKYFAVLVVVFFAVTSVVFGRFVTKDKVHSDPSRTLKGVMKYYKNQPRITDSASLEFDEVGPIPSDTLAPVNDEDLERLQKKNAPHIIFQTKVVAVDDVAETTTSPLVLDDENGDTESSKSKSDLYADEMDDVDECVEGDVMKVACNTCVCSDGQYFCSKRACNEKDRPLPPVEKSNSKRKGVVIKYHSIKGVTSTTPKAPTAVGGQNATTADGELFQIGNGTLPFTASEIDISQCIDGRTKPVDCNQCVCALGQWACTKMSCIALSLREKASYSGDKFLNSVGTLKEHTNIDEDCMEGEAKPIGCNQCVCHRNSWACSDFKCPSTVAPPTVETVLDTCQTEEDVKSKDCNICSCRRGLWVCSTNDCKKFGNRYFNPVSHKHNQSNESDQES